MASWLQTVTQWGAAVGVMAVVVAQYTARWIMPFVLGADYGDSARVLQVMLLALPALVLKLAAGGFALALLETLSAKMRIFRVPEFLATAFLLAVIGLLTHILLGP